MSINLKDDSMLSLFIQDSKDYLNKMSNDILRLEKEDYSKDIIDEMFRAVHSMKGASGILELNNLMQIAHDYETVLDKLRSGKLTLNKEIIDFMFEGLNILNVIIDEVRKTGKDNISPNLRNKFSVDAKCINENLKCPPIKINETTKEKDIKKDEKNIEEIIEKSSNNLYKISLCLKNDDFMKKAKLFLIYNEIVNEGVFLHSNPKINVITNIEDETEIDGNWIFYFDTKESIDNISNLIKRFEVENVVIEKIKKECFEKVESKEKVLRCVNELPIQNSSQENILKDNIIKEDNIKTEFKVKDFIKVEKDRLDQLFNIVGELFIEKSAYNQMSLKLEEIYNNLIEEGIKPKKLKELSNFISKFNSINKIQDRELTDLQDISNSMRMVSIKESFSQYSMAVRTIAHRLKKKVDFQIKGEDTEIDKAIAEKLIDPMMHMIRNAIDHGIESEAEREKLSKNKVGKIIIEAFNSGNNVIIKLSDDGRGIDLDKVSEIAIKKGLFTPEKIKGMSEKEKIDLIFLPGFSTAEEVSDLSGRGVGMDVVKKNIESIKGSIEVYTEKNVGTTFILKLPLTLAIVRALLVESGKTIYSFPSDTIVAIEKINVKDLEVVNCVEMVKFRGKMVSVIDLKKIIEQKNSEPKDNEYNVLFIKHNKDIYGFKVEKFINQQYIVIKNIEGYYHRGKFIVGAAILGDGKLSMVIDTNKLIEFCKTGV